MVQTMERLKLLLLLTVADIFRRRGPASWTGWKGELLRTLYSETELVLGGGDADLAATGAQSTRPGRGLRAQLPEWSDAEFRCLCRAALSGLLAQGRRALSRAPCPLHARGRRGGVRASPRGFETDGFRGVTEITVVSPDHPRLLAIVTVRLCRRRRQHRRCPDLHHGGWYGARYDLPVAGV